MENTNEKYLDKYKYFIMLKIERGKAKIDPQEEEEETIVANGK